MQNILLNHPMPNVKMDRIISPNILRLIKEKKTKSEIVQLMSLMEDQFYCDIETLIKTGQPILKTDLSSISDIDFTAFRQCINEQEFDLIKISAELLKETQTKYLNSTNHQIDSGFTRLALVYYAVRFYLNRLNVPYVDCEENVLINAEKLIVEERQGTLNTTFETDREYPPFRRPNNNAQIVMDLLFGECVNCDRSYNRYDSYSYESEYGSYMDSADSLDSAEFGAIAMLDEYNDGSGEENNSDVSNDGSEEESDSERSSRESEEESDDDGIIVKSEEESNSDVSSDEIEDGSDRRKKRSRIMRIE